MAAPRCALDVWKYVHRGNAHRINQPTNQRTNNPTSGSRYAEGAGRRPRLREFPPLSRHRRLLDRCHPPPLPDLFRLRIPSDLFSRAAPGLFFTFHRQRRRLRVSAPISLDRGFFAILFAPSLSHPRDESRRWGRRRWASRGCSRRYWDSTSSV